MKKLDNRFEKLKVLYDSKARQLFFETAQREWLFNPRRIKGRTPKLQSN